MAIQVAVKNLGGAGKSLEIMEDSETIPRVTIVPFSELASWCELLGYASEAEALEARMAFWANSATEEGAWSEPYALLRHREAAREAEAASMREEGHEQDIIEAFSANAAYNAVHQPVAGGECAMDRCRRATRAVLEVDEPSKKPGADSRIAHTAHLAAAPSTPYAELAQPLLEEHAGELFEARWRFLSELNPGENPLLDPAQAVAPPLKEMSPAAAALAKYSEVDA